MSITSLTRTLTATSVGGRLLRLVNGDDKVGRFRFDDEGSEQTSAMTSLISAGFNRKGCCSLMIKKEK